MAEEKKKKKNSIAWNQLAASIRELMSSLYPTEALDQESKCLKPWKNSGGIVGGQYFFATYLF